MTERYLVYGSGDEGTKELMQTFFELAISVDFRDIRSPDHADLKFVREAGFATVPQVYAPNGSLIGNFEATMAHLSSPPTIKPKRIHKATDKAQD